MKVIIGNNESQIETRRITIVLNEDVELDIKINSFGELEIQKTNFGQGESAIVIKPSVSNEIRLS
jgi:hypothetical protein